MENDIAILPCKNESPTDYADRLGVYYTSLVHDGHKKIKGQYFTPSKIARYMGKLADAVDEKISILDPGCGTAILTCSLIEQLIAKAAKLKSIQLTAYETDPQLIPYTEKAIAYLMEWLNCKEIVFSYRLIAKDFILENADVLKDEYSLNLFENPPKEKYDYIISNPPYFKLSKEDRRTKVSEIIVCGQPNIYALFMAVSAKLLNSTGQLIFITPRSFASGNYFKVFRSYFFNAIQLQHIHLFASRKDTFDRDSVLQETLIIKAKPANMDIREHKVTITSSLGLNDLNKPNIREYFSEELMDENSDEKILYLPVNDFEEDVIRMFRSWTGNLKKYNIQISTGPVVAFRATEYIRETLEDGNLLAPLYWLHNVTKMQCDWPVPKPGKGQYIQICQGSKSLLVPNKNYIFLRRFSSKDDKNRLIASPYFLNTNNSDYIGIENKLNYIYRPKGNLNADEAVGLAALLNSKLFDTFFRTFNGNINVSATELREMPLPPLETIKEMGERIIMQKDYSLSLTDEIVSQYFEINHLIEV